MTYLKFIPHITIGKVKQSSIQIYRYIRYLSRTYIDIYMYHLDYETEIN